MRRTTMVAAALAVFLSSNAATQEPAPPAAPADPAAARRQERSDRFYVALWWVQAGRGPLGRKTVRDGDYVLRSRLLPPSLIRLSGDAVAERGGRVVVAAGTQLFGLSTSGPPIWCELARRSSGATVGGTLLGGLVGARAPSQRCLADLDRDGRLDAFFAAPSQVRGVPNFSGYRPRNPDRLAPAGFERLEPAQIEREYFVGIRYEGISTFGANPVFSISFGHEESRASLTERVSPRNGVVDALGGEFEILGRDGETIEVEVRRNLPPRPFHVIRTVTFR